MPEINLARASVTYARCSDCDGAESPLKWCVARIIHMPLSGGDRKAHAKAMRDALGLAHRWLKQSEVARAVGDAKLAEADMLLCDAWSNFMFWGQRPQVSPSIGQAINGRRPLLWAKCPRCGTEPKIDLRELVRRPDTPVRNLERALFCSKCSGAGHYRVRAHILGLMPDPADPEGGWLKKEAPASLR